MIACNFIWFVSEHYADALSNSTILSDKFTVEKRNEILIEMQIALSYL